MNDHSSGGYIPGGPQEWPAQKREYILSDKQMRQLVSSKILHSLIYRD